VGWLSTFSWVTSPLGVLLVEVPVDVQAERAIAEVNTSASKKFDLE
jgi:hypothetical protein